jgi:hypothetical protein
VHRDRDDGLTLEPGLEGERFRVPLLVLLRFVDGLSSREIGQVMDRSEGAARVLLHRALKDLAARLFLEPFRNTSLNPLRGLGVGLAGSYGNQSGALRGYVTPGQQTFFSYRTGAGAGSTNVTADGLHWRLVPQAYYYWGPFGLLGEYAISSAKIRGSA